MSDTNTISQNIHLIETIENAADDAFRPNVTALARVYHAIEQGDLTINGLLPDASYSLGEYLIHGGRIRFNLSQLTSQEIIKFKNYIFNQEQNESANLYHRRYATHRVDGRDVDGNPAEVKTLIWGAILDTFGPLNKSVHKGIDVPVGAGALPDGQWGHMYIGEGDDMLMVGMEPSAYGKSSLRTKEFHSVVGLSGKYSPFGELKINTKALAQKQFDEFKCPLSTPGKYNWANVTITRECLRSLLTNKVNLDSVEKRENFKTRLGKPHKSGPVAVKEPKDQLQRMHGMLGWQKATKAQSTITKKARWVGIAFIVVGVIVTFTPIPFVSQAIGGLLVSLGIKTVALAATATVVSSGVFGFIMGGLFGKLQAKFAKNKFEKLEMPTIETTNNKKRQVAPIETSDNQINSRLGIKPKSRQANVDLFQQDLRSDLSANGVVDLESHPLLKSDANKTIDGVADVAQSNNVARM